MHPPVLAHAPDLAPPPGPVHLPRRCRPSPMMPASSIDPTKLACTTQCRRAPSPHPRTRPGRHRPGPPVRSGVDAPDHGGRMAEELLHILLIAVLRGGGATGGPAQVVGPGETEDRSRTRVAVLESRRTKLARVDAAAVADQALHLWREADGAHPFERGSEGPGPDRREGEEMGAPERGDFAPGERSLPGHVEHPRYPVGRDELESQDHVILLHDLN